MKNQSWRTVNLSNCFITAVWFQRWKHLEQTDGFGFRMAQRQAEAFGQVCQTVHGPRIRCCSGSADTLAATLAHEGLSGKSDIRVGYFSWFDRITYFHLQLVAHDIVKFLKNNEFKNGLLFHGFSVGGYLWGECLVHIARDLQNYQVVLDRVKCQIWDSAADITEIPEGVPRALFPRNPTLQNALRKYMLWVFVASIVPTLLTKVSFQLPHESISRTSHVALHSLESNVPHQSAEMSSSLLGFENWPRRNGSRQRTCPGQLGE